MKKLKDIREAIEATEQEWLDIANEISKEPCSVCSMVLSLKKEHLKNLLEDVRCDIVEMMSVFRCAASAYVGFLERIFDVSEKLNVSYVFPGYDESLRIRETWEEAIMLKA